MGAVLGGVSVRHRDPGRRAATAVPAVAAMLGLALAALIVASSHRATAAPDGVCSGPQLTVSVGSSYTFGVIGDFGDSAAAGRVAALVKSWNPAFIATVGDNAYNGDAPSDGAGGFVWPGSEVDMSIGQWFWEYIGNYRGAHGTGPAPGRPSRFFPAIGNHDWDGWPAGGVWSQLPYRSYFTLPGNERYYTVRAGSVQLFVVDSEPRSPGDGTQYETDGVDVDSVQARWLRDHLADSTAPYKIVLMHHPPYTSAPRGSNVVVQWPYAQWGASAVFTGHEHLYERLSGPGGIPFVITGHGGQLLTNSFPNSPAPATSLLRIGDRYGALRVDVTPDAVTVRMFGQPAVDPNAAFTELDRFTVPVAPTQPANPACTVPTTPTTSTTHPPGPLASSVPPGGATATGTAVRVSVPSP